MNVFDRVPETAKDAMLIGPGIVIPAWIADPQWIPPVLLWGGLVVLAFRLALVVRDWRRGKRDK